MKKLLRHAPTAPVLAVHAAGLSSRAHLVYAASYLRHLLGTHDGDLYVDAHPSGGFAGQTTLDEAAIRAGLPAHRRLHINEDAPASAPVVLLCVGVPGIKPFLRELGGRRRPWVVVCDEGIGTYGTYATRRDALSREGAAHPRADVVAAARTAADALLTDERWHLYRRIEGRWVVSDAVAAEFRRSLDRPTVPRPAAVYLTQPWVELGLLSSADYRAHLDAVAQACAASGLGLEVRPHPVEDPARYAGLPLITGATPAELDARVVSASVALGGTSTALLNLAAIQRMPAIRLALPQTDALDAAMSPAQASLFDTFVPRRATAADLVDALAGLR